jgi:hypothetical protein
MTKWVKGMPSPNKAGRPRGIIERRARVTNALLKDAKRIAEVVSAAGLSGDLTAAAMIMDRSVPKLKAEGSLVRFHLDTSLPTSQQFAQVTQAIADGQLTLEEGKQIVDMIKLQAEARAADGAGDSADKLTKAFREMAGFIADNGDSLPTAPKV